MVNDATNSNYKTEKTKNREKDEKTDIRRKDSGFYVCIA